MAYLMDAIDEGGTRRKLEDITASGLREFDEIQQRSAQLDEEFRETQAKQEAEAAAMDKLVADAKAAQRDSQPDPDDEQAKTGPWVRRDTKPVVHAFGGEEFAEEPTTEPSGIRVPPLDAPSAPPPPVPPAWVEPVRELAIGYEDDEDTSRTGVLPPAAPTAPVRRRASGADEDDDLSGHSWMR